VSVACPGALSNLCFSQPQRRQGQAPDLQPASRVSPSDPALGRFRTRHQAIFPSLSRKDRTPRSLLRPAYLAGPTAEGQELLSTSVVSARGCRTAASDKLLSLMRMSGETIRLAKQFPPYECDNAHKPYQYPLPAASDPAIRAHRCGSGSAGNSMLRSCRKAYPSDPRRAARLPPHTCSSSNRVETESGLQ